MKNDIVSIFRICDDFRWSWDWLEGTFQIRCENKESNLTIHNVTFKKSSSTRGISKANYPWLWSNEPRDDYAVVQKHMMCTRGLLELNSAGRRFTVVERTSSYKTFKFLLIKNLAAFLEIRWLAWKFILLRICAHLIVELMSRQVKFCKKSGVARHVQLNKVCQHTGTKRRLSATQSFLLMRSLDGTWTRRNSGSTQ